MKKIIMILATLGLTMTYSQAGSYDRYGNYNRTLNEQIEYNRFKYNNTNENGYYNRNATGYDKSYQAPSYTQPSWLK